MQKVDLGPEDAGTLVEMLARFELFAGLSSDQVRRLLPLVGVRHYDEGEVVFRKDDPGDAFYAIAAGSVEARVPSMLGESALRTMGPGDFFGELALLLRQPRSATVVCLEPCELFVILSLDFQMLLDRDPDIAAAVRAVAKARFDHHP